MARRILLHLVLPGLILPLLAACSDETVGPGSPGAPSRGFYVTSPYGSMPYATWGTPVTPDVSRDSSGGGGGVGQPSTVFRIANPFPNPTRSSVTIPITVVRSGPVLVWIERVEAGNLAGAVGIARIAVDIPAGRLVGFLTAAPLEAGEHDISWNLTGPRGRVSPGIYRIFVETPSGSGWRDVLVYDTPETLPEDLRTIVARW